MKKLLWIGVLVLLLIAGFFAKKRYYDPKQQLSRAVKQVAAFAAKNEIKDGDIIFQTSLSKQSLAIQLATHSKYSHCGIIYKVDGNYFVFEAVQPVKLTPLAQWIAKGEGAHFVIRRLKDTSVLTPAVLAKMKQVSDTFKGKDYDLYFDWSDDKMYCSELIWKIYKRGAGLAVGKLQKLRDFDLTNTLVKQTMKKRYGNHIPYNETVISPVSIFNSGLLITVVAG